MKILFDYKKEKRRKKSPNCIFELIFVPCDMDKATTVQLVGLQKLSVTKPGKQCQPYMRVKTALY